MHFGLGGIFFDPGYLGVSARGGPLCECRDFRGIQAIVANLQEFWESRGELGEAQGRCS